jgi:excisionase family DNA binding protein
MSAAKKTEKQRPYLTPQELKDQVVDWSRDTLERRIKNEGFPAIRDGNSWLIPVEEMHLWFKKRKFKN